MRLRRFTLPCLLALSALFPLPTQALRPDILYLGGQSQDDPPFRHGVRHDPQK